MFSGHPNFCWSNVKLTDFPHRLVILYVQLSKIAQFVDDLRIRNGDFS
jgi:hypothetical protein